jgi:hypothetical protein
LREDVYKVVIGEGLRDFKAFSFKRNAVKWARLHNGKLFYGRPSTGFVEVPLGTNEKRRSSTGSIIRRGFSG